MKGQKMDFRKLIEGVADNAKTFELINRGYSPDVFKAGDWFEAQEDEYWYFLECLPPMDFMGGAFSICEFSSGDLTNMWVQIGSGDSARFFCVTIQRRNRDDFAEAKRCFLDMLKSGVCA
jgi:hypothetical protein